MKAGSIAILVLVASLAGGSAGWLLGREHARTEAWLARVRVALSVDGDGSARTGAAAAAAEGRQVLYYRDPQGRPYYSYGPKKDSSGADYVPVYEDEAGETAPASSAPEPGRARKILYYRNPMGLPDISSEPKKDSMGMDYIPVYEDEAQDDGSTVKVSLDRVQRLGVRTEPVSRRPLVRSLRLVGAVQVDEQRVALVSTRFEGWIEKLHVAATGAAVRRGQALMRVYSPALLQAQQEYLVAWRSFQGAGADSAQRWSAERLVAGAEARLRNLDAPPGLVARLRNEGKASRSVTLVSAFDGTVLAKFAVEGMRFMPGEPLYRIVDLSTVWVIGDINEQDLAAVGPGQAASVTLKPYPGRVFEGRISFVYPTVDPATRTGRVRIEIPNPNGELKTDMYASVELAAPVGTGASLAIPDSALVDSGTRQVVLVEKGEGRFEPRPVRIGAKAAGHYEVLEGIKEGERVVVAANFLLDAESNLQAALRAFTVPEAPR